MFKKNLCNWGLYPKIDADVLEPNNYNTLSKETLNTPIIARGNGRCYGDSSLQKNIVSTLKMNKILSFNREKGIIQCESGIVLSDLLEVIVPQGYFLPITPGTKFITLGGAVASNIHGKNHHKEGAIADYINELQIFDGSSHIKICSKTKNKELFINTIGGMGLTGIIVSISITLKPIETSYIKQTTIKIQNLNQLLNAFEAYNHYTYSVAWIDCITKGKSMGRSILMLGEHASRKEIHKKKDNYLPVHTSQQINIPFYFPTFTLNKYTISLFNTLYYNKQLKNKTTQLVDYDTFFYPLDKLKNWNRIYGKNGFTQYQFVIPFEKGREGLNKILKEITSSGCASFLAVLKSFGKKSKHASSLSFPEEGYTLALDFKISNKVFSLLDTLDTIVLEYGGKVYLSKDSRMSQETFQRMYSEPIQTSCFLSSQYERLFL